LKVFDYASVDSTYSDGETWMRRTFKFVLTTDGVESEMVADAEERRCQTSVRLVGLRAEYEKHFPKSLETLRTK
jgi:hypothetical protein